MDRRTFAKGLAWSVPVLGVAVAAPLAAASEAPCSGVRLIGSNFTKKSLKLKVKNDCGTVAKNVMIFYAYNGHTETIALGDIGPHQPWPLDHARDYDIPEDVTRVTVLVTVDGVDADSQIFER